MSVEQAIVRMNPSRQLYAAEAEARLQEARRDQQDEVGLQFAQDVRLGRDTR